MRICFFGNPDWTHIKKWSEYLSGLGHEMHIIFPLIKETRKNFIKSITLHNFKVNEYSDSPNWLLKATKLIEKIVNDINPDIFHIHGLETINLPFVLLNKKPLIVSVYGLDITRYGKRREIIRSVYFIKKFILESADKITATTRFLADATTKYGMIKKSKISVIPFGVDTNYFNPKLFNNKKQNNFFIIGMLKTLNEEYKIGYFIKAIKILKKSCNNFQILIAGDGNNKLELQNMAKDFQLMSNIKFLGRIKPTEVRSFLSKLDILVMPSLHESFGVTGLEAQSMEIPVVAVNVEGVKEVIQNNITGITVPPKNSYALAHALNNLLQNSVKRNTLGKNGRKFVKNNYEWLKNAAMMHDLYVKLRRKITL